MTRLGRVAWTCRWVAPRTPALRAGERQDVALRLVPPGAGDAPPYRPPPAQVADAVAAATPSVEKPAGTIGALSTSSGALTSRSPAFLQGGRYAGAHTGAPKCHDS